MEKAYTVKEVALKLGCNERTVYRAIWKKRLKVKRKQEKQKYLITEENFEGFQASIRGRGKPAKGKKPSLVDLQRLYVKEQRSIRDIAELLGCSKDAVYRALREYGIETRSHTRESKLDRYSPKDIRKRVEKEGIVKVAGTLGISRQTLWEYLKKSQV